MPQLAPLPEPEFPAPLQCLFQPKRYKVLWGGRAAGRSWGVARALLLIGAERPVRILCAREFQNSISDSVHKLLSDQIIELGLERHYDIQVAKILGKNGTNFSFEGIKNNITRIKSYEGIDYCWVEEAIKVSRNSWGILIPTIRKEKCPNGHKQQPGNYTILEDSDIADVCGVCGVEIMQSEIWMTFNPELETDYTYQRFVLQASPKNSYVVKMTHADNPWFPRVLYNEMIEDRKRDYDHYLNIWEGHCLQMLEGTVYAKELRRATEEGRICTVGWDREVPVDTFWDLGRADATAIWFAQKVAMQYRVLAYYEATGHDITHYLQECQRRGYVYGMMNLPHDAAAKRLGSKRTIEEIVRQAGYRVRILGKLSVVDGINAARIIFPNCWFDEKECVDGLNALRHYRYRVVDGHLSNEPLHDWASDGADAFRYMGLGLHGPRPKGTLVDKLTRAAVAARREFTAEPGTGSLGWLR